jgi:hypothetical protein
MEILNEIDRLTEAVTEQCGFLASVLKLNHASGTRTCQVQIRAVPDGQEARDEDWIFFKADQPEDLPRLRDQVTDFIVAHRIERERAA